LQRHRIYSVEYEDDVMRMIWKWRKLHLCCLRSGAARHLSWGSAVTAWAIMLSRPRLQKLNVRLRSYRLN
jgi:hypothetical protein